MKQQWGKYDPAKNLEEHKRMLHLAARRLDVVTRDAAQAWERFGKALRATYRKGSSKDKGES